MINSHTRKVLQLTPLLKTACESNYIRLCSDYDNEKELEEAIGWWSTDPDKLNSIWWTLNYNSVKLDPHRKMRAKIEHFLDVLADNHEGRQALV